MHNLKGCACAQLEFANGNLDDALNTGNRTARDACLAKLSTRAASLTGSLTAVLM